MGDQPGQAGHPEAGALITLSFVLAAVALTVIFRKVAVVRSFCAALVVLPLLFLAGLALEPFSAPLALLQKPALGPDVEGAAPVVLVVLDEFPVTSMTDGHGRIDATRTPNLAAFAKHATWFPNATSVSDETSRALPALLSGQSPDPDATEPPRGNLFTLLARSHSENVQEVVTHLCPPRVCPEDAPASSASRVASFPLFGLEVSLRNFLPRRAGDILLGGQAGALLDAELRRREFQRGIGRTEARPPFHFLHLMMPHSPWGRLPDGRQYSPALPIRAWLPGLELDPVTRVPLIKNDRLSRSPEVVQQAQQAHLAQVGAADRQVGMVLDRLKATGGYERSVIVVMADHGAAFRPGGNFRRLTRQNAPQILGVPLFIKRPGQVRGDVDNAFARTTDVLPTIAREAGVRIPWRVDGRALFQARPRPGRLRAVSAVTGKASSYTPGALARGRLAVERQQAESFGPGTRAVEVFRRGPRPDLLGRRVRTSHDRTFAPAPVTLGVTDGVIATSRRAVKAAVGGRVTSGRPGQVLAVVVGGRVVATTRTYTVDGEHRFSVLLPPSALPSRQRPPRVMALKAAR